MPPNEKRQRFLLTTVSCIPPADVIYCADDFDYQFITDNLRRLGIGFCIITPEDATKLIANTEGIGAGCYIPSSTDAETQRRKLLAESAYRDLVRPFGFVRFVQPIELPFNPEWVKARSSSRFSKPLSAFKQEL